MAVETNANPVMMEFHGGDALMSELVLALLVILAEEPLPPTPLPPLLLPPQTELLTELPWMLPSSKVTMAMAPQSLPLALLLMSVSKLLHQHKHHHLHQHHQQRSHNHFQDALDSGKEFPRHCARLNQQH